MSTNKTFLPEPDTPEAEKLISVYTTCSQEEIVRLGGEYGYKNKDNFVNAMRRRLNVFRGHAPNKVNLESPEPETINLPPVTLRNYKPQKVKRGDEETAVLAVADGHACKVTVSYNRAEYDRRMWNVFTHTMKIVNLHRQMYPINKLKIFNLGDNAQGENPHQGSVLGAVESNFKIQGARDQTTKVTVPMWNNLLGSFAQEFEEVEFHGIPGNHGYDKLAPETSREDLRLYDMLDACWAKNSKVKINVHELWYALIKIYDFTAFCFHGCDIPSTQGIPFFAMDRRLKSWHMQFGGFNYVFSGHFHHSFYREIAKGVEHFGVGTLVSDDDWALKKLGVSSSPRQFLCGFHPRHGMTWQYQLDVL